MLYYAGGASGSPVLGDDYTVKAIHTFWDTKGNISGGVKISSIIEVRRIYPILH